MAPILSSAPSVAAVEDALRRGPYGRCVWACDNDVVDQQVVNIEFEGGATASLTTVSGTEKVCQRFTRIFGSRGQLEIDAEAETVRHFDFETRATTVRVRGGKRFAVLWAASPPHLIAQVLRAAGPPPGTALVGHGGADYYLMHGELRSLLSTLPRQTVGCPLAGFVEALLTGDPSHILSGPDETLESHLVVFAGE